METLCEKLLEVNVINTTIVLVQKGNELSNLTPENAKTRNTKGYE